MKFSILNRFMSLFRKNITEEERNPTTSDCVPPIISFEQGFFLYVVSMWRLYIREDKLLKEILIALIAIIVLNVKKKVNHFPNDVFNDFIVIKKRNNDSIHSDYLNRLIKIKIDENLLSMNDNWEFELTVDGKKIVHCISGGGYNQKSDFGEDFKNIFTPALKKIIDYNSKEILLNVFDQEKIKALAKEKIAETIDDLRSS